MTWEIKPLAKSHHGYMGGDVGFNSVIVEKPSKAIVAY